MKGLYKLFAIFLLGLAMFSCTSSPFNFDTEEIAELSVIEPPEIAAITLNKASQEFHFEWIPTELSDLLKDLSLSYYTIYYQKKGTLSPFEIYEEVVIPSGNPVQFSSTKMLPDGFGDYYFQVQPLYNLNETAASLPYEIHYQGLMDFELEITGLSNPQGVVADSSGSIYVANTDKHQILKFTSSGSYDTGYGSKGSGTKQFHSPKGLSVDTNDTVFVADANNDRVISFVPTLWNTGDSSGFSIINNSGKPLNYPSDIAKTSDGLITIADTGNSAIQTQASTSSAWLSQGSFGSLSTQFKGPLGIDSDASLIVVADTGNSRIVKYDTNHNRLSQWGVFGSGYGHFKFPSGIAIDSDNQRIFVSDTENHRIQVFNYDGVLIALWGMQGTDPGEFTRPTALHFSNSKLYVADSGNNRIQVFKY